MRLKSNIVKSCRVALALAIAAGFAESASAASLTWDIAPGTIGLGDNAITGGAGTWDLSNGNWTIDGGVNNIAWDNLTNDTAIFGGTMGTVTLGSPMTAGALVFNSGYTVTGTSPNILTLAGATTPTIAVTNSGDTATISAIITGTTGLTKSGLGTLTLGADNTYTGATTVSAGTLRFTNTNQLDGATSIAAGATLNFVPTTTTNTVANVFTGAGLIKFDMAAGAVSNSTVTGLSGFTGTLQLAAAATTGDKLSGAMNAGSTNLIIGANTQLYNSAAQTFSTISVVGTGNTEVRGAIRLGSTLTVTNGVTLQGDTTIGTEGGTLAGRITGTATIGNMQTLTLGTTNSITNGTFSGAISDGVNGGKIALAIGAVNMGDITLSGVNTYSGGTIVNFGRVIVNANSSALGAGTVTIVGDGTVGDAQVYAGAAVLGNNFIISGFGGNTVDAVQRGALRLDSGATVNGTVTLSANAALGSNSGIGNVNGVVSGAFNLTKVEGGTIVLRGANTFSGKTSIANGTLSVASLNKVTGGTASSNLGAPTTVANGTIDVGSGGTAATLNYTGAGETTDRVLNFAGTTGGAFITNNGTGLLRFNTSTTTGVGGKGIFFGGTSNITIDSSLTNNGGVLNFTKNDSNTVTLSSGLNTGTGASASAVTVNGGTLVLGGTAASNYTGATTINAGTLNLAFGAVATDLVVPGSAVTLAGGSLKLTGTGTQTITALGITANTSNRIILDANETLTITTLTAGAGSSLNFNTATGGADATTTTVGTSIVTIPTVTLTSAFTVTDAGGFGLATRNGSNNIIRNTTATLLPATGATSPTDYRIDNNAGGGAADGSSSLLVTTSQAAGSITVDTTAAAGTLNLDAGITLSNNTWNFGGVGTNTYLISGGTGIQSVASGNAIAFNNYNTGAVTIATPILASGTNAVTFSGTGTTILTAANAYTGATTIASGSVVNVQNATSLGTVAGGVSVANGGALQLQGGIAIGAEALTLNGTGINNDGALRSISGANSYSGAITLGSNSRINSDTTGVLLTLPTTATISGGFNLSVGGAGNTTIASVIGTGAGALIKDGAGTLTLSALNNYTGGTTVNAGTLVLNAGGPTGSIRGILTVNSGATVSASVLDAFGYTGGISVTNLNLNGGTFTTAAGLTGNQGYITNVNMTGGTLAGVGIFNFFNGYGISSTAAATISTVSSRVFINGTNSVMPVSVGLGTVVGGNDLTISGVISSSAGGSLVKTGAGTLNLSAYNTYSGGTTVSGGTLRLSVGGTNGTILGIVTVNAGATLVGNTGDSLGYNPGAQVSTLNLIGGTFNNAVNANQGYSTNVNLTGGTMTSTGGGSFNFNTGFSLNSLASPTTSLISSGVLIRSTNTVLPINVADGTAAVDLNITGIISNDGNGGINKTGAGTLRLSAINTNAGPTTVTAGRLLIEGSSLRSTSGVTVASGATLEVNAVNIFTAGHGTAVDNSRVVTVNGGTLLFSNTTETRLGNVTLNGGTWTTNRGVGSFDVLLANTSTGAATVNVTGTTPSTMNGPGGLHLQGVQNFSVADVTSSTAADLTVSQILAGPGGIGGALGGINKLGAGTMVLAAANTYTGTTTVNAGSLVVTGSLANNGISSILMAAPSDTLVPGVATLTRPIASGLNTYAGFGSKVTIASLDPVLAAPLQTTAEILMSGNNALANNMTMQWRTRSTAEAAPSNTNAVLSDVISLTEMGSDIFVLQMSYTDAALNQLTLNETAIANNGELRLGWKNLSGDWVSAVSGNNYSGGGSPTFAGVTTWSSYYTGLGGNGTGSDLNTFLGAYGVDPNTNTVWAVLNHNSEFAVIPEPSTLVLGGLALLGFAGIGLRRRRQPA